MDKFYVGVDIGGTNIKLGVIDSAGNIIKKSKFSIEDDTTFSVVIAKIIDNINEIISDIPIELVGGIGLGIPGLIDTKNGLVVCSGNLNWTNEDVLTPLKNAFSYPIKIANDANVAALGEAKFGVGKAYSTSVFITLGTGVGSGIIIDGKIYDGNLGAGAELGHMVIEANGRPCTCGGWGCFEAYASATSLKEQTRLAMLENDDSLMWEIGGIENISGKTAFLYSDKDASAKKVVDEYIDYLSVGIVNVANIFRPQAIILGGGVSYEGDKLLKPLNGKLSKRIFAGDLGPKVEILLATLRNDAGFMGAAALNID